MRSEEQLRRVVAETCFTPVDPGARRLGAEFEWIPVDPASRAVVPIDDGRGGGTLPMLRAAAAIGGWSEGKTSKGAPVFHLPEGGAVTYEPGGQIEHGTPPLGSVSEVARRLAAVSDMLTRVADDRGIRLVTLGLDPENPPAAAPLLLDSPRYRRMAAHLATVGHAGARMMRQTAAVQLSVDLGDRSTALRRWQLLNAAAPILTAVFANSPLCEGQPTGHPSHRAWIWRQLDPTRTGLPWDDTDPIGRYLEFALDASAFLLGDADTPPRPFRSWWQDGLATPGDWQVHLTTLFPEVRPRGYFEVRGIDSLPPEWVPVPLLMVSGLAYDEAASLAALDLLGAPDPGLLDAAAHRGLADERVAVLARDLVRIALEGARRLSDPDAGPLLERGEAYADRYTRAGRAPADDVLESLAPLGSA